MFDRHAVVARIFSPGVSVFAHAFDGAYVRLSGVAMVSTTRRWVLVVAFLAGTRAGGGSVESPCCRFDPRRRLSGRLYPAVGDQWAEVDASYVGSHPVEAGVRLRALSQPSMVNHHI